jgi:hypothetical protein
MNQEKKDKPKCCETCHWCDKFEPRQDELARGLVLGCKLPGYEGYTSPLRMACSGTGYLEANHEPNP